MIFEIPIPAFSTVEVSIPLVVLLYIAYAIVMVPVIRFALRNEKAKNDPSDLPWSIFLAAVWPLGIVIMFVILECDWEDAMKKRRHG